VASPTLINAAKTECIHGHSFSPENTYRKVRANGRIQRACRTCAIATAKAANWGAKNPDRYKAYHKQLRDVTYKRNEEFVTAYLHAHPCVDCGEVDIRVLEFDHVYAKRSFCVRGPVLRTLKQIDHEIAKCQVRCANCHTRRHYQERHKCQ